MKRIVLFLKTFLSRFTFLWKWLQLTKRQQFVAVTAILTALLILTQTVPLEGRYLTVVVLFLATYALSALVLREELQGIEWFTLLILPSLFSGAVALFYFLLPARWLTRIPVALLYAVGLYALLLTENIFNVAANRTIALLRAAHSIGFLLSFVIYFLLSQIVFAFRLGPFFNAVAVGVLSFLLNFQALWSMELETKAGRKVTTISIVITVVMMEVAAVLSFLPAQPLMNALFIASVFYSLVGMSQQYMIEKMYKKTVIEFFVVSLFVLCIYFLTIRWQ